VAIALVLISVFVPVAFLGGLTASSTAVRADARRVGGHLGAWSPLTFHPALCALLLKPTAESHFGGILAASSLL